MSTVVLQMELALNGAGTPGDIILGRGVRRHCIVCEGVDTHVHSFG